MGFIQDIKTNNELKRAKKELELMYTQKKVGMLRAMDFGYSNGGASKKKNSLKGWIAQSGSPAQDIDMNLDTLRQRSRDAYMSAPIATAAIKSN